MTAAIIRSVPSAEQTIAAALRRMGLLGDETPPMAPLVGGISSDIWRVELAGGPICVKRALPRLKVDALWEVPTARNRHEWDWLTMAARVLPTSVPRLLGRDDAAGCFAMTYLEPTRFRVWKQELAAGQIDPDTATAVGASLGRLHAATAGDDDQRTRFATDKIFAAIRLDPYLRATAARHPALSEQLRALADRTAQTRLCVVHGDVSPKNILVGPDGPVFLDAECAWYGDPAFDLAFCLNHLLLKCIWRPEAREALFDAFDRLVTAYEAQIDWELTARHATRTATLLSALLLARVDGKSPVEYLDPPQQQFVRTFAIAEIRRQTDSVRALREAWRDAVSDTPWKGPE